MGDRNSALTNQKDSKEPDHIPTPDKGRTEHGFSKRTGSSKYTGCYLDFRNPFLLLLLTQGSFLSSFPIKDVNRNSPCCIKDPQLHRSLGNQQPGNSAG